MRTARYEIWHAVEVVYLAGYASAESGGDLCWNFSMRSPRIRSNKYYILFLSNNSNIPETGCR